MKSKIPLPLMEQLIMVLVFALTSAGCLQGVARANRLSGQQESQAYAVIAAQNAAEVLKHVSGDFEQAAGQLGGHWDGGVWSISYDDSWQTLSDSDKAVFHLQAIPMADDDPLLGTARIKVFYNENVLFEITVAWQEADDEAT